MPSVVSETSWADLPGTSLQADTEVTGLGVGSLLTPVLAEVWRTGPSPSTSTETITDTNVGGVKGSGTTRLGTAVPPAGYTSATAYQNISPNVYVWGGSYSVEAGIVYEAPVQFRRRSGTTTLGSVIIAEYLDATGQVVRTPLPMTAVPQDDTWRRYTLTFRPGRSGPCTIYYAADTTGTLTYELSSGALVRLPGQQRLMVDLGAQRSVVVVALAAPRDGVLPEGTATIRATLSATGMGGTDCGVVESPLDMGLGYWCWVLPAAVTARYLLISIASAQPYLQFGRLWVGSGLSTPSYLAESGFQPSTFDDAAQPTRRRVQFTLPQLSEPEAQYLEIIGVIAGTQRQVLAIPRVERASRSAVIGKFTAIPAPRPRQAWSRNGLLHTASLTIQEDR
jgi:hypothetical protein